jgi:predicted rRNA methylase YqxC with S4 and FtsJ domains
VAFTRVLLDAGAGRVYAVDAGHGQLLGSLRQDSRVINLEATNLGNLTTHLVPDEIDVVTLDLSYLALSEAMPQLENVRPTDRAHAIELVKPQFELGLARPPNDRAQLLDALNKAREAVGTNSNGLSHPSAGGAGRSSSYSTPCGSCDWNA